MWTLITWLKEGLSSFLTVKSLSPPVPIHLLFKRKSQYLFASIDKYLLGLSRILLQWKIFYSSHLFNYSLISVWSYKYIFYTLDYNAIILILLLKLSIFVYWESFQLVLMPFDIPHQWVLLFCERFLTLCYYVIHTLDTSCIFSVPRISLVSKQPWLLLLENGNRNPDLNARYAHYYWALSAARAKKYILCIFRCFILKML